MGVLVSIGLGLTAHQSQPLMVSPLATSEGIAWPVVLVHRCERQAIDRHLPGAEWQNDLSILVEQQKAQKCQHEHWARQGIG